MVRDTTAERRVAPAARSAPVEEVVPTAARVQPPRDELAAFALLVSHPALASTDDAARILDLLVDPGVRQVYRTACKPCSRTTGGRTRLAGRLP